MDRDDDPEPPAPRVVRDPDALRAALARLDGVGRVGLDVEGDGLYRYRSRLCLVQIAAGDVELVIDPLALEDLSPLAPLLGPDGPEKVVHDVSFDVKMLATRGLPLQHVFDTSVAARFLSEPSTGLAALLAKHFGVEVDKSLQQADWGERPLSSEGIEYVIGDVRHLAALRERLHAELADKDLLDEVAEETRYALARALDPEPEIAPWTRIKGARDLPEPKRALLEALADVREREAKRRDVPPFRVAPNRALFEAARRGPRRVPELRRVRGLRRLDDDALADALAAAADVTPPASPTAGPSAEERARRKAREKALSTWRAAEAERRAVDPQAVLPGHCLRDLARLDAERGTTLGLDALAAIAGFGDARVRRYGEALLGVLRGADG